MILNINLSHDEKNQTLTKPYIKFILFKINFEQKNGPINVESGV